MSQSNLDPSTPARPAARLALSNGMIFTGQAFGDTTPRAVAGEVCFNTSMAGYQEILTDPSYAGQIVTMTYPLIGNYGVNEQDVESNQIHPRGFVVRELANRVSNHRATQALETWLASQHVVGITGIDTRALTKALRVTGAMNGVICTDPDLTDEQLVAQANEDPGLVGLNLAEQVSSPQAETWDHDLGDWAPLQGQHAQREGRYRVVALDCGAKRNILRNLADQDCEVIVLPFDASAEDILKHEPDGLFVSNGPGDPSAVTQTIHTLQQLLTAEDAKPLPTFGICLGHQLLALALGAETYKLKFGHRGANHPIQNLATGKVEITSQNHGFAVDTASLQKVGGEPSHINLNDQTLAGFRHTKLPIFAIQYHPEASPGPHDARYLFDCFRDMMASGQAPTAQQMDEAQRSRAVVTNA